MISYVRLWNRIVSDPVPRGMFRNSPSHRIAQSLRKKHYNSPTVTGLAGCAATFCGSYDTSMVVRTLHCQSIVSSTSSTSNNGSESPFVGSSLSTMMMMMLTAAATVTTLGSTATPVGTTSCQRASHPSTGPSNSSHSSSVVAPAVVAKEDFEAVQRSHDVDAMPVYSIEELSQNNGENGNPVWMSYGGVIYDVTDFINNHPGGSEKILQAAGSHVEPFWYLYRQHFASDLPMRLMEHMAIGRLSDADQEKIDEQLVELEKSNPYAKEPRRDEALIIHSDEPCNAEVPTHQITEHYLTPPHLFYIRHHHPVPYFTDQQIKDYKLTIDLSSCGGPRNYSLSIDDLKAMDKTTITATLQCSGNRRSGYNVYNRTSGTTWGQGAISTSKFGGVLLSEVLKKAGVHDPIAAQRDHGIEHVRFYGFDGMSVSIPFEKAMNPYGDVLIVYEMNDQPLPREHGYPIRMLVPGYNAVRSSKWVNKIELSKEDADSPFQRGLNYKVLPPSVTDANEVDLSKMPSITEASVFSGITSIERISPASKRKTGSRKKTKQSRVADVHVKGWAWAGGGRNIVRVDITGDEGATWSSATLKEGSNQRFGRAWAWVFWDCIVPNVPIHEDGTVHLASKAVDMAFNSQPEHCNHMWNVRGLCNNSWYRARTKVVNE